MFGNIQPTPYDLQFSLFGIPVRVHPGFWILGVILGWRNANYIAERVGQNMLAVILVWLAVLFISILVHELGHALTARAFGWPPQILLYHFGGLAMYSPLRGHTPKRSIMISLAGPSAGFVLYGLVVCLEFILIQNRALPLGVEVDTGRIVLMNDSLFVESIRDLKWINLYWGLINLLPVLPLDGGRVSEQILGMLRIRNSDEVCVKIGIVIGGGVALLFLMDEKIYAGFLFAFLCVSNIQTLQANRRW